ncbi:MAG: hypothetical protein AAB336_06270 [Acidobacteriota bacterium]
MSDKQQDTLAILKLYELRRDEKMREARHWFMTEFRPQSGMDIVKLLVSGEKESAYFRMITSYWDMAASLVNNGGINRQLFLDANTEHVVVFAKIQPFLAELRQIIDEEDYDSNLEKLVLSIPNIDAKLEKRRQLLERWTTNKG